MDIMIRLSEAQQVIKDYCRKAIDNRKYTLDAVDTSADLCKALEAIRPHIGDSYEEDLDD